MTRYALVDIGSNTVRMNIYDVMFEEKKSMLVFSKSETLGLINHIENTCLTENGIQKLIKTLRDFKLCAGSVLCDHFVCFATASLREISNKDDVLFQIKNLLGIGIDIISGDEEALYNFYGLQKYFNVSTGLLIDIGGGSVEILSFCDGKPIKSTSEPIGSLALFSKYCSKIMPKYEELEVMIKYIDKKLEGISWLNAHFPSVFCIGGTARTMARMHKVFNKDDNNVSGDINGYKMKSEDISALFNYYKNDKKFFMGELLKLSPERVHTFIPGLLVYTRIIKIITSEIVTVSSFGVREGYLINKIMN